MVPTTANEDDPHYYVECGNKGICDRKTGECVCFDGYEGSGCRRSSCPSGCSGHGVCRYVADLMAADSDYTCWDDQMIQACKCDPGYFGPDCSQRMCPKGDDPMTVDCSSPTKSIYTLTFKGRGAAPSATAEFVLQYTDMNGMVWNTTAIPASLSLDTTDIEKALLALPNRVIPGVTVSAGTDLSHGSIVYGKQFVITFSDSHTTGAQTLAAVDVDCLNSGCQPLRNGMGTGKGGATFLTQKIVGTGSPTLTASGFQVGVLRETASGVITEDYNVIQGGDGTVTANYDSQTETAGKLTCLVGGKTDALVTECLPPQATTYFKVATVTTAGDTTPTYITVYGNDGVAYTYYLQRNGAEVLTGTAIPISGSDQATVAGLIATALNDPVTTGVFAVVDALYPTVVRVVSPVGVATAATTTGPAGDLVILASYAADFTQLVTADAATYGLESDVAGSATWGISTTGSVTGADLSATGINAYLAFAGLTKSVCVETKASLDAGPACALTKYQEIHTLGTGDGTDDFVAAFHASDATLFPATADSALATLFINPGHNFAFLASSWTSSFASPYATKKQIDTLTAPRKTITLAVTNNVEVVESAAVGTPTYIKITIGSSAHCFEFPVVTSGADVDAIAGCAVEHHLAAGTLVAKLLLAMNGVVAAVYTPGVGAAGTLTLFAPDSGTFAFVSHNLAAGLGAGGTDVVATDAVARDALPTAPDRTATWGLVTSGSASYNLVTLDAHLGFITATESVCVQTAAAAVPGTNPCLATKYQVIYTLAVGDASDDLVAAFHAVDADLFPTVADSALAHLYIEPGHRFAATSAASGWDLATFTNVLKQTSNLLPSERSKITVNIADASAGHFPQSADASHPTYIAIQIGSAYYCIMFRLSGGGTATAPTICGTNVLTVANGGTLRAGLLAALQGTIPATYAISAGNVGIMTLWAPGPGAFTLYANNVPVAAISSIVDVASDSWSRMATVPVSTKAFDPATGLFLTQSGDVGNTFEVYLPNRYMNGYAATLARADNWIRLSTSGAYNGGVKDCKYTITITSASTLDYQVCNEDPVTNVPFNDYTHVAARDTGTDIDMGHQVHITVYTAGISIPTFSGTPTYVIYANPGMVTTTSNNAAIVRKVEDVECSSRGICNRESGLCECFEGFTGEDCSGQTILV